ncbi:GNAT family N-acetyltransferase [Ethanoligenens harbinense]|uniref:GCN5-related N-acetyltransferase n=1 Tax=Ethanoligenens harbinense (strain DSM 18485 / JCM 12961 / CGMCC 1.5033 / YUAN-3) TaxID=663278 RepID=E6U4L3_ETHHY|nr:GNAT family N-acetyltransferase [Ethanoligenens harbinense]ADU26641.1 GCN5-related N-acetyltransferase [Ethanoligenens harbinense YUAN-3]AVQ95761.1 N-acetyltransferase [Ethanoligenens harbinense YUAN-3]AYF38423.1 N-acetyltransferase [Ethanoligenens harbinense]AYF41168.1 N-acetyltransferase [Ethanoligenens harbinense]QCN92000.1 GNAT family N-acetyltransferase [Ethanoligenens harbinense]
MLDDLARELPAYRLVRITENEYDALFSLQQSNPHYFSKMQNHPVTYRESIAGTTELPPNTARGQKNDIGFYRHNAMVAILDYVVDYPEKHTIFIGFFMVDGTKSRRGIGKTILSKFIEVMQRNGFTKLRLACIEGNEESYSFWKAMGLHEVSKTISRAAGRKDWHLIVMERDVL